jgi:hypothetical protein
MTTASRMSSRISPLLMVMTTLLVRTGESARVADGGQPT